MENFAFKCSKMLVVISLCKYGIITQFKKTVVRTCFQNFYACINKCRRTNINRY